LKKNKEILIATSNKGKVNEFINLFEDYDVFSLTDLGLGDAVEDGTSFLENALIKAKHGSLHSGKYTIADDSGLVIPKLDYEPGIFSARYAGSDASDKDNRNKVIQELNNLSLENLDAYYVCCLVGIRNHDDPMPIISYGKINGKVSVHSSGEGGFGYDKIFYPSDFDCSMASIDIKVKNTISHRAIAVKDFINKFKAASS
tara:strand:- start:1463 stop:2065 length:603 start_codon:yes stop_codon:yes gene_type:complete